MPPRRMSCWQCPRYQMTERRCLDGKTNPRSKDDSLEVARMLGLQALCHYNPYRDLLALRMYHPNLALTASLSARRARRKGRRPGPITIEIEECAE